MEVKTISSSFRDPSGFLFSRAGKLYRQINDSYRQDYDHLISSGLYGELTDKGLLIKHQESNLELTAGAYKIITPELIPFISYPYEWSFSQLKDAALLTLEIQKLAFEKGMVLKDASAYNVQFLRGKPILIDTLSFERYVEGEPWVAYKQFCQHFLAPLALMSKKDVRLNQLLRIYIDGVPLDLAASLLPFKSRLSLSLFAHIFAHAQSQKHYSKKQDKRVKDKSRHISKLAFRGLIDNLSQTVKSLNWNMRETEWGEYYTFTNYSSSAFDQKKQIISKFLGSIKPKTVYDLGANDGEFSRVASDKKINTIAFDIDPVAVEKGYLKNKELGEKYLLTLLLDLTNPSPALGFACTERDSIEQRGRADVVFALALIHHMAISNNLPFDKIASYFATLGNYVVAEFIPKSDSKVKKLLSTRKDIFPTYDEKNFELVFKKYFKLLKSHKIKGSKRTLYLFGKKAR